MNAESGILVNGEEFIALKAVIEQLKAETYLRKKDINSLQLTIIELSKELRDLRSEYIRTLVILQRREV